MYPRHTYSGYHPNSVGTWNKATIPQNSQGIAYAFSYAHPEMAYVEKTFSNPYGNVYAAAENDYYRQHYITSGSQQDSYNRHCSNIPNTARPPPPLKPDNADNTFHASLSMLENPTQNSAAAYTANWVSSTSSIPPELRDEPEVPSFNGLAHSGYRDDLVAGASAVFTPPASTFAEQFSSLSVHEKQWSNLGQSKNGGVSGCQGGRRRIDACDRHGHQSSKELTWDERIRKGAVQKERVEQRGLDKSDKSEKMERDCRDTNLGSSRRRGQRGGRSTISNSEPVARPLPSFAQRDMVSCKNGRDQMINRSSRAHCYRSGDKKNPFERRQRIMELRSPQYYHQGIPLMMSQGSYYNAGPNPLPCMAQQDQRFRNTWLDANFGLNYNHIQMNDYSTFAPRGQRCRPHSRGRSGYRYAGRSGYHYSGRSQFAKESSKTRSEDQSALDRNQSVGIRSDIKQDESPKVDEEDVWEFQTKDREQKRNSPLIYWPFEDEKRQEEENEDKFNISSRDATTDATVELEAPRVSVSR
ncbi:hypothetical protein DICVIV_11785 [Dictyocaulus viviparus]|uniref:Uncharacterized protein n=1 Tax=Dictyocaulus viviparus TaxID=29172 RepID=A0A0D8XCC0_DICVI|nr:hypothetical protein DICVIV_11785 [Dictyocaulus viviparus]